MGFGFLPKDLKEVGNLVGGTLGKRGARLPDGTGYWLPKRADVVLQVHYHRTGKEERDRPQIGLYFDKDARWKPMQLLTLAGLMASPENRPFTVIPVGQQQFRVRGKMIVETAGTLYSVLPHMHMLGKSIRISMTTDRPDCERGADQARAAVGLGGGRVAAFLAVAWLSRWLAISLATDVPG